MKQLSETTAELIETCRVAHDMLGDQEFIDSLLKATDESAFNPSDLESALSTVAEFHRDALDWQRRLRDKLERRSANQAKYAEIERLEKQVSTAIDTIRLGHRAVAELDDSSYAPTLFERAKVQLESIHYDVS